MTKETVPIPVSAGEHIAKKYGYDQVVIIARRVGSGGVEHVTTYGMNTQDKLAEALREVLTDINLVKCDWCKCHTWWSVEDAYKTLAEHEAHAAEAVQAQAQSGEWVMVPKEPTEWMLQAAEDAVNAAAHCESTTDDLSAIAYKAALAAAPQPQPAEPVGEVFGPKAVSTMVALEHPLPPGTKLYTHPQPAQDAKDAVTPLKGWIFGKVDMGRGDERYICTPDGANATTVRNESTSDHRERMLWMIADAMSQESGR